MTVEIRHVDDSRGTKLGDIRPSEIQPLIDLIKGGIPVYSFNIDSDRDFEGAVYSTSQLIKYENEGYIFEIIVE